MSVRTAVIGLAFRYHRRLAAVALGTLVVFVLSASLHVLLTWTGPQSRVMQPPALQIAPNHLAHLSQRLQNAGITAARIVKVVPSEHGPLLQVTQDALSERRYIDLNTGESLPGHDSLQARWLARHYVPDMARDVVSVEMQTEFSADYPWVNRLLPVYRVKFTGDDGLTAYVHTETLALAALSNHHKHRMQWAFRQLHTWQWLERVPYARVIVMVLLLITLLAMLLAGLCLLWTLRRSQRPVPERRAHRRLAHVVSLPLLGFTASGLYHLLHHEFSPPLRDFNLAVTRTLPADIATALEGPIPTLNSLTLLALGERWLLRGSVANTTSGMGGEHDHHAVREQRYTGVPREAGGVYWDAHSGQRVTLDDATVARDLVVRHLNVAPGMIRDALVITHFGPGYDFRNKRLPVWQVDLSTPEKDRVFIDVASGVLVDRTHAASRLEGLSFSVLHKWNFLVWPIGRESRDGLMLAVLLGTLVLAGLGWRLRRSG